MLCWMIYWMFCWRKANWRSHVAETMRSKRGQRKLIPSVSGGRNGSAATDQCCVWTFETECATLVNVINII